MRFLLFTYYTPMTTIGEIAPANGAWRSRGRPAQRAGLVAAALGLRRDDPAHSDLEQGLGYAIRTNSPAGLSPTITRRKPRNKAWPSLSPLGGPTRSRDPRHCLVGPQSRTNACTRSRCESGREVAIGLEAIAAALTVRISCSMASAKASRSDCRWRRGSSRPTAAAGFRGDPVTADSGGSSIAYYDALGRAIPRVLPNRLRSRPRDRCKADHVEIRRDAVVSGRASSSAAPRGSYRRGPRSVSSG